VAPSPSGTPASAIPPAARAALAQAVEMNGRLAASLRGLRTVLAAPTFDASDAARHLRTISADALYAEQLAARVGTWSEGSVVAAQLAAFYGGVHDAAADGLVASVRNVSAYRAAATAMVELLSGLGAIYAGLRSAAATAGISLPAAGAAAP
jgi:ABC-type multidrug transport system fused ATPase/permease subunit